MPPPFKFWTYEHWLNFGLFVLGALTAVGITATTGWAQVPNLFTPATTIGFFVSLFGFLRASETNAARDPELGTRASDPNPTAPLVQTGPHEVSVIPPVNPGRPVDPENPPKEQP